MGLETTLKITCDYPECGGQSGRAVLSWVKELIESGQAQAPPESQYLVTLTHNGVLKTFCGQLHAAMYFLPPGYEVKQKKVIEFPAKGEFGTKPTEESNPEKDGA